MSASSIVFLWKVPGIGIKGNALIHFDSMAGWTDFMVFKEDGQYLLCGFQGGCYPETGITETVLITDIDYEQCFTVDIKDGIFRDVRVRRSNKPEKPTMDSYESYLRGILEGRLYREKREAYEDALDHYLRFKCED